MGNFLHTIGLYISGLWPRRFNVADMENSPRYQKEMDWYMKEFKPKVGADYTIALTYAKEHYEEAKALFTSLDKKAEWFYGLAIVAMSAVYLLLPDKTLFSLTWGIPSLLCAFLALWSLVSMRLPTIRPTGMTVRGAMECVEHDIGQNATPWICANLHCAIQDWNAINAWKAYRLHYAGRAILVAFLLVPLVMTTVIIHPQKAPILTDRNYGFPKHVRVEGETHVVAVPVQSAVEMEEVKDWEMILKFD
jgi:hypothetical protein